MNSLSISKVIFKRMVLQGNFGRANKSMRELASYLDEEFEKKIMGYYTEDSRISEIDLRSVVPVSFRPLFMPAEIRDVRNFFREMVRRRGEFTDKRENYRMMVCFYGIYLAFIVRVVETHAGTALAMAKADESLDPSQIKMEKTGLRRRIFSFYSDLITLREKTVDDWLNMEVGPDEEMYVMSAVRRVLFILGF